MDLFDRCHECGAPAEFYCDFAVSSAPYHTCDLAMCRAHRHQQATGIGCGRKHRGSCCRAFSIDYCSDHAAQSAHNVPQLQEPRIFEEGRDAITY